MRAARLIDYLLARQQRSFVLEQAGRLPASWAYWLRTRPLPRPASSAAALVAVLLPRAVPASPGRLPSLPLWQAMRRLAWQQWDPAPADQRRLRWFSAAASLALHLLLAVALLWLALLRPPSPQVSGGDGDGDGGRVRMVFIGSGASPDDAQAVGAPSVATAAGASAAAEIAAPPSATATAPAAVPVTADADRPAAAALPPAPPPVQATEVVEPTHEFVVPPLPVARTEVSVVPREATATATAVREREIHVVQAPTLATRAVVIATPVPDPRAPVLEVRERPLVLPVQAPALPTVEPAVQGPTPPDASLREREVVTVTAPAFSAPPLRERAPVRRDAAPSVRERPVPDPVPDPAPAPAPMAAAVTAAPSATPVARPPSAARAAPTLPSVARPDPVPGNWAAPARGDDWGAARDTSAGTASGGRRRDTGSSAGLFDADGRVRLPGSPGAGDAARGAPGGDSDGWSRERIAQSGTWLKRPPYDHVPTSLDKYWVPNESLLAEWVRRGVKSIEIPLPGTGTRISCVISVLQFGGGCGLSDPNMQDQPAVARPPPDIPFRKDLQEGR